jgi:hypothetical protein
MKTVQFFKGRLMLSLAVTILLGYFTTYAQAPTNPVVGMKTGYWAKYVGSIPYEEFEWIRILVSEINGTKVNLSVQYDLRSPYRPSSQVSVEYYPSYFNTSRTFDVASGGNNLFLYIIPANLSVGDLIPVPSAYPKLSVNGTDLKEYAGVQRTVVYASSSNMSTMFEGEAIIYWDRETGLLLEILAKVGNCYFSSLRLIETNIWSVSLVDWLARNLVFVASVASSMALLTILSLALIKKKEGKRDAIEIQLKEEVIEEKYSPFRHVLVLLHDFLRPRIGRILMLIGLSLFVIGFMSITLFEQVVASLSLVFAVVFVVVGLLVHTEAWTGTRSKIDLGVIMISLSVILFSVGAVCVTYREIGAMVPCHEYELREGFSFGIAAKTVDVFLTIDAVFLYPLAWIGFPLATVALCLALYGIFVKIFYRS